MNKIISTNPGRNYEFLGEIDTSSEDEVKDKVRKARQATDTWRELGITGRGKILHKLITLIKENKEELAGLASSEMGMPIKDSREDIDEALRYFTWYLDNTERSLSPETSYEGQEIIHKVHREPIGVAAVIIPWNYPASNFVWGCGQNLLAGNTVVLKHSEECPLFGKLLEEIISQCGLPTGVFSEIYGGSETGELLIHQDIDIICFTGSSKTGKYIYQVAAEKFIKVVLEMGGSAPGLIFEDANINQIIEGVFYGRFFNSGQSCDALKRLIVHESRSEEVITILKSLAEKIEIGDPLVEDTSMGPLVAERQVKLLEEQLEDAVKKGAQVLIGGKRPLNLKGAYFEPTILTGVNDQMRVWREEVFGPVLPIVSFSDDQEAIRLANDTEYGLGAYIYTEDISKAREIASKLKTGMVSLNNASYLQPSSPFGGYKQSGLGREHGKYGFEELTQIKVVAEEKI